MGGDANDGILSGTVAVASLINLKPDQMLVYLLRPARQVIVADQLHKFSLLGRLGKMPAIQYPLERPLDLFRWDGNTNLYRGLMFGNGSLHHRASSEKCPTSCQLAAASGSRLLREPRQAGSLSDIGAPPFSFFRAAACDMHDPLHKQEEVSRCA
jgi:hypothetical protein